MSVDFLDRFRMDDLDMFETWLERYVEQASTNQLLNLIGDATRFIENQAADSHYNSEAFRFEGWTYLNNATSAINTAARALARD